MLRLVGSVYRFLKEHSVFNSGVQVLGPVSRLLFPSVQADAGLISGAVSRIWPMCIHVKTLEKVYLHYALV